VTYTQAIGRFAAAMREQMRANSHKGGWEQLEPDACYRRAMQEMVELGEVLHGHPEQRTRIVREAADVANFLMMLQVALEAP
jgi:hypothetical protein